MNVVSSGKLRIFIMRISLFLLFTFAAHTILVLTNFSYFALRLFYHLRLLSVDSAGEQILRPIRKTVNAQLNAVCNWKNTHMTR